MLNFATVFATDLIMKADRDYTSYTFWITLLVILGLIGVSQLPAFQVGGAFIKRVNILSDVLPREDSVEGAKRTNESLFDTVMLAQIEAEALSAMDSLAASSGSETDSFEVRERTQHWNVTGDADMGRVARRPTIETRLEPGQPLIEDYGGESPAMEAFYQVWDDPDRGRPLRIAVLGDSFIEGDILTADLREQLQQICGGSGVGFVPFATAMAKFRASVLQQYSGWQISTLQQRSSLPEELQNKFFVSGSFAIPSEGASTRLEGTRFKQFLDECNRARLLFINREATRLEVLINDSVSRSFTPPPGEQVQQIVINAPIRSIRVDLTQTDGFIGYGIILEDPQGVSVDNFSIRGNSGLALYGTNRSINYQIDQLAKYDLVILQYGLNVISADVTRYDYYGKKLVNIIRYMQQCFPGSSILVMGVGDRSTQREGQFVTMPGVYGMIEAQRTAAREAGVAFWDTFEAMGGPGSMPVYVKNKWAAQDYTHIRHPGGRQIATKLVASLVHGRQQTAEAVAEREQRAEELRMKALQYQTHLQAAMEEDSLGRRTFDTAVQVTGVGADTMVVRAVDSSLRKRGRHRARVDSLKASERTAVATDPSNESLPVETTSAASELSAAPEATSSREAEETAVPESARSQEEEVLRNGETPKQSGLSKRSERPKASRARKASVEPEGTVTSSASSTTAFESASETALPTD